MYCTRVDCKVCEGRTLIESEKKEAGLVMVGKGSGHPKPIKKEEQKYRSSPWSSMRKTIILATEMQVCLVLTLLADALHKFCKLFYFCKTLGYLEPSEGIK